ncbi:MAG: ECF-type sigma factor [Dokdonella sp.]
MSTSDRSATPAADQAVDALFTLFYDGLKRAAHRANAVNAQAGIGTTMLVHEAYLKLRNRADLNFESEAKFYAYAARVMRSVLLDSARMRLRAKRDAGQPVLSMDITGIDARILDSQLTLQRNAQEVLALDHALEQLGADDARAAEVVELHYFAGLSFEQIAPLKELSVRTVKRDWEFARAFLYAALADGLTVD